jgi:hypothetical protein
MLWLELFQMSVISEDHRDICQSWSFDLSMLFCFVCFFVSEESMYV